MKETRGHHQELAIIGIIAHITNQHGSILQQRGKHGQITFIMRGQF
jgi:hypothetical protein